MTAHPKLTVDLQECMDAVTTKRVKPVRITKNTSDDVIDQQVMLWKGRLAGFVVQAGREDLLDQIGHPDIRNISYSCGGAHNIGNECACGFGHCIYCHNWIPGTCGWNVRCNATRCAALGPPNVFPRAVVTAPVPVTADPKKTRKKSRGKAKGGADSTESDDGIVFIPTTPLGTPPGSPPDDLWQTIVPPVNKKKNLKSGKGTNVVPAPPPIAPQVCTAVHTLTDICRICGVNACIICEKAKPLSVPWDSIKGYNCGCGAGPAVVQVDLTADPAAAALPHDYPLHWSPPEPGISPYIHQIVDLDPGTAEYADVVNLFEERNKIGGMLIQMGGFSEAGYASRADGNYTNYKVTGVQRVQNLPAWTAYNAFLQGVMAVRNMERSEAEETVFHGTDIKAAENIAAVGFNHLKTATAAFGYGSYHDKWGPISQVHAKGERCVIQSKIASGKIGEGMFGDTEPPSGCDCGASSKDKQSFIRVSYRDSQMLPEHILLIKSE